MSYDEEGTGQHFVSPRPQVQGQRQKSEYLRSCTVSSTAALVIINFVPKSVRRPSDSLSVTFHVIVSSR